MKCLILQSSKTNESRKQISIAKAISVSGIDCCLWRPDIKPTYDAFDEYKPDIFVCSHLDTTNRAIAKCIKESNVRLVTDIGLPAADIIEFGPGKYRDEFATDVFIFSSGLTKEEQNTVLDICYMKRNVKIFGSTKIPCHQYCGNIPTGAIKDAIKSAKTCIDVSKTLTDIPFMFSVNCDNVVSNCQAFVDIGKENVMGEHTYFHRAAKLLENIGLPDYASKCMAELARRTNENVGV